MNFIQHLNRQVEALEKLTKLTDSIKERPNEAPEKKVKYLCEQVKLILGGNTIVNNVIYFFLQISQADYMESLQNFYSPLENTLMLGELVVDQCKVMDSAKKPLWLVSNKSRALNDIRAAKYFKMTRCG